MVAKTLRATYGTAVLFATGQCDEVEGLNGTGAVACLPKPYSANLVPAALHAVCKIIQGDPPAKLPDHMFELAA